MEGGRKMADRSRYWLFLIAVAMLVVSRPSVAQSAVQEPAARIDFGESQLNLTLPLVSPLGQTRIVSVALKLLDPHGKVIALLLLMRAWRCGSAKLQLRSRSRLSA